MGGKIEDAHRDPVAQEELERILSELSLDDSNDEEEDTPRVEKAIETLTRIADLAREPENREPLGSQLGIIRRVSKILAAAAPTLPSPETTSSESSADADAEQKASETPTPIQQLRLMLVEQALRVVANVVADTDSNRLLFLDKTKVASDLVRIIKEFGGHPVILRNCCGALGNLACDNHKVCTALQKLDGHIEVLSVVRRIAATTERAGNLSLVLKVSDDQRPLLSLALRALGNMCHSQMIQKDLVGKGNALPVFKTLCETRDDQFIQQIIQLITDLGGEQQAIVLQSGMNQLVFDLISDMLTNLETASTPDEDEIDVLDAALRFVTKSFQYTSPRQAALPDMIAPLFRILSTDSVMKSKECGTVLAQTLDALIQFTSDKSLHERLLKVPEAKFLVPLTQCIDRVDNLQVSARAVMVLSNICVSEAQCIALTKVPSLVEVLCRLVQAPLSILANLKLRISGTAMGVLRTLAIPARNKRELVQRGMLPTIFSVFTTRIDPQQTDPRLAGHMLLQTVVALRHLATKCAKNLDEISTFSGDVADDGKTQATVSDADDDDDDDAPSATESQSFVDVLSSVSQLADGNTPLDFEIGRCLSVLSGNAVSARRIVSIPKCVKLITTLLTSEHEILHREGTAALRDLCKESTANVQKIISADESVLDTLFKLLLRSRQDADLLMAVLTQLRAMLGVVPEEKRKELFVSHAEKYSELISKLRDFGDENSSEHSAAESLEEFRKSFS